MSPGVSLSNARVTRMNRPSEASRVRASILAIELELIDCVEERAISIELRTDPSLYTFHLENLPFRGLIVIHGEKRLGPRSKSLLVRFFEHREVTVAIFGRGPDGAHFGIIDEIFGQGSRPILITKCASVGVSCSHRVENINFACAGVSVFSCVPIEADKCDVTGRINSIQFEEVRGENRSLSGVAAAEGDPFTFKVLETVDARFRTRDDFGCKSDVDIAHRQNPALPVGTTM